MIPISGMILMGLIVVFVITLPFNANLMSAQAKIIYYPINENNTRLIVNTDNLTQTLVDATTNETISVEKLTIYNPNATTNEIIPTDMGNATTKESTNEIIPTDMGNATTKESTNETITTDTGNATTKESTNETITTDTGNATTNINLTAKFNALQGK